jgi:hypothetical protein
LYQINKTKSMKNKKFAIIILLLFASHIFIDIFYDNKILSKSLLYLAFILTALNFTKLNTRKDYSIFIIGVFCYMVTIITKIFYSEFFYCIILFPLLAILIHFGLYYKNKED